MWCTGIRKGSRNHDPLWISEIHLPSRIMCSFLREGAGLSPHPTNHETTNTMKKRTNPHHRLQTHPPPICRLGSPEHPTAKRAAEKDKFSAAHIDFSVAVFSGKRARREALSACQQRDNTITPPARQLRTFTSAPLTVWPKAISATCAENRSCLRPTPTTLGPNVECMGNHASAGISTAPAQVPGTK